MDHRRALIEDCCGWNRKTWADALEFAISRLPADLSGKRVLEIGASNVSVVAPVFAYMGAEVTLSYFGISKKSVEDGRLKQIRDKYNLSNIAIEAVEMDANNIDGIYDIIVMKSVLGGLCKGDDYNKLKFLVTKMIGSLSDQGQIITLDNGYIPLLGYLRKILGTHWNGWTYFTYSSLIHTLDQFNTSIFGFGLLNCASSSNYIEF